METIYEIILLSICFFLNYVQVHYTVTIIKAKLSAPAVLTEQQKKITIYVIYIGDLGPLYIQYYPLS